MKSLTIFLGLLFVIYAENIAAQDISTGLVVHYQFEDLDGAVVDAIGEHHGTNYGAVTGVPGKIGNAFQFNGTGYVKIDNHSDIAGYDEFTLAAWINPASLSGHRTVLAKVTAGRDFVLKLYNQTPDAHFYKNSTYVRVLGSPVQLNQWIHVLVTWKNNQWKIYQNGQLVNSSTCSLSNCDLPWGSSNFFIGSISASAEKFIGMIDEVRIYNRALSAADAATLFSYNCSGSSPLWAGKGNDVFLAASGNVGIGTSTPGEKLTVKGTVHAEEIIVDLNVPAPDYVFEKDYDLTSIEELEKFIMKNSHLPNFPPALEMETNGIDMVDINMKLLRHIEELTLHIIAQEKRIIKMENQLKDNTKKK